MIVSVDITEKSFGSKSLYDDLRFDIQPGEKLGIVGRNGTGKSTLLHMITGDDIDFQGEVKIKKGIVVIASRQEHHGHEDKTVLEYIQGDLPEFAALHRILSTYPATMGDDPVKIQRYSDTLERFTQLGYFQVEDELGQALEAYQLPPSKLDATLSELSGGQKRMIELIKVQRANGHLALIDEPTNHMDYVAKQAFITWFKAAPEAVVVITHDRDVLAAVDRIVEIRDGRAHVFKGNYEQYLRVNRGQVTAQVNEYDLTQRRIQNLTADVIRFRRLKEKSRDPGTIKRFKSQEEKAAAELAKLSTTEKPSFWIDRANADELDPKMTNAYQKYKAKNIRLDARTATTKSSRLLVQAHELSLGYDETPLFESMSFSVREGERIRLHGRNGAGKTTLMQAIMARVRQGELSSTLFAGTLSAEKELALGIYEQEIAERFLPLSLHTAIELSYREKDVYVTDQKIQQLLGEYLFDPISDGAKLVSQLSGGQKARLQLIRMLANQPSILLLDEPTNHLDLPSIEELEDALAQYHGAVIYISHDSYFAKQVGGETVQIGK
ncbi:MAG: ATP-binding cassette, subfamily er 3 [Patescibacteria group bacterium]|nr:ABC-F family ATP-binding cassette domain-containing protein [Candidatus Saccharibacteria bacterium]MDQ5963103.1 ATP-binding cassette, subfamily er 3 [Patescibacteria group bacterium]